MSKIQWHVFSSDFWLEWFQKIIIVEQGLLSYLLCDRSKTVTNSCFSSVQFRSSVVSDSLRAHESQHARPPCPSPTPRVHSNSVSIKSVMPSSHLILWRPLLLLPPIPPSIRVFSNESTLRMRGGQSTGVSASASVLPMNTQD